MTIDAVNFVEGILQIFKAYAIAGLIFAVPFVTLLVKRLDPGAQGLAIGFRLLILPGVIVFWPLFAIRLVRGKQHPTEKNAHRTAAKQVSAQGG